MYLYFILTVEQHEPHSKTILNYPMINPLNSAWNISLQQPLPLSSARFNMGTILNWHLNYLPLLSNKFLHSATVFFKPQHSSNYWTQFDLWGINKMIILMSQRLFWFEKVSLNCQGPTNCIKMNKLINTFEKPLECDLFEQEPCY